MYTSGCLDLACCVCVLFTLNRSFCPSTSCTTSVRAESSILEEIQVMWSQSYATEIRLCPVSSKHSSGQCNAVSSYWVRQARHTHSMKYRNERKQEQSRQIEREKGTKRKKNRRKIEETNYRAPPPQAIWQTLEK